MLLSGKVARLAVEVAKLAKWLGGLAKRLSWLLACSRAFLQFHRLLLAALVRPRAAVVW